MCEGNSWCVCVCVCVWGRGEVGGGDGFYALDLQPCSPFCA